MKAQTLFLMAVCISCNSTAQPSFLTIGSLPGAFPVSTPFGVSWDGTAVTGDAFTGAGAIGFVWRSDTGIAPLPPILNSGSYNGTRFSPSGNIIIGRDGGLGAIWSSEFGNVSVGDVSGGSARSFLFGVNDAGLAVGMASHAFNPFNASLFRAVQWTPAGGLETLPLPGGEADLAGNSAAYRVLADGRILGDSNAGAWLYSESTGFEMFDGALGMTYSSADGTLLAGTASPGGSRAAYWTREEGLTLLPLLPGDRAGSNLFGMSDDGSVFVGMSESDPVVWIDRSQPIRVIDFATSLGLDMDGWVITNIFDVSGDGSTIVGSARHVSWELGRNEGFVLTIPGPGAAVLAGLGVGVVMAMRRRR